MEKEVLGGQLRKLLFNHLSGWIHLMSLGLLADIKKKMVFKFRESHTCLAYFGVRKKSETVQLLP